MSMNINMNVKANMNITENKSRGFLGQLSLRERICLANAVDVSDTFLFMVAQGVRTPSRETAVKLELATDGKVKDSDFAEEVKRKLLMLMTPSPEESS
ncbi:MAG: hypothetical protein SFH39_12215 [Candidatus Magnetobacterium sp. LHC-1]|nr:hypothetical protein [Nitrospirota bacterium]